ncbi:FecR domain-containing protein [Rhizobium ecuadorense]|uniref:FecR domain-containing protein n=1 Tax=Rhizobium ecuadorense TaxID=1671795 RepID=UPI0006732D38|nr:FecR domain-containing protein [Rhizobium ecuadorense]
MLIIFRILIAALIVLPTAVFAAADDWRVVKATDQVKFTVDRTNWQDLRAGEVVPNRAWVSTGPRGRVQLSRGVESITFQPNTLAAISNNESAAMKTQIFQQVGSLDLEIEKRSQPHTTVQTPYLAALVKGTIFHVTVNRAKASVAVDRGLVQVTSFASGQRSNVAPGQSATVDKKAGMTVAGRLSKPEITSVAASVAQIPAVGTTKLAGATAETKSSSSATNKNTSSSASEDDSASNGKSNGNSSRSGNGNSGNSGGNGNGNSNSGANGNNGNGNGHSDDSGNNGNGNGHGNGNSGKGDNNSGGNGNGNSGGKGKDK